MGYFGALGAKTELGFVLCELGSALCRLGFAVGALGFDFWVLGFVVFSAPASPQAVLGLGLEMSGLGFAFFAPDCGA